MVWARVFTRCNLVFSQMHVLRVFILFCWQKCNSIKYSILEMLHVFWHFTFDTVCHQNIWGSSCKNYRSPWYGHALSRRPVCILLVSHCGGNSKVNSRPSLNSLVTMGTYLFNLIYMNWCSGRMLVIMLLDWIKLGLSGLINYIHDLKDVHTCVNLFEHALLLDEVTP